MFPRTVACHFGIFHEPWLEIHSARINADRISLVEKHMRLQVPVTAPGTQTAVLMIRPLQPCIVNTQHQEVEIVT